MELPRDYGVYTRATKRPGVRWAVRAGRALLRTEPLPSDDEAKAFARSYFDGDPAADAFVNDQAVGSFGRARALLEQVLQGGPDAVPHAPASLKALLHQITSEPAWLDHEKVERGARVYRRLGVPALSIDVGGQMLGYTEPTGVRPVILSGSYTRNLHGRLIDTSRYHLEASEPGALVVRWPAPEGLAITLRVRILHAYLRARVAADEGWRDDEWGVPISQFEMMGPMLGQSLGTALAANWAGLVTTDAERDALLHFWRWNGYLMGCDPVWFPSSPDHALRVTSFYFLRRSYEALADCAAIVERVPGAFAPRPGAPLRERIRDLVNQQVQIGWLGIAFGPSYGRFDLPSPALGWVLNTAQFPLNLALTLLAWSGPAGAEAVDRLQRHRRRHWYTTEASKQTTPQATYTPRIFDEKRR